MGELYVINRGLYFLIKSLRKKIFEGVGFNLDYFDCLVIILWLFYKSAMDLFLINSLDVKVDDVLYNRNRES